MTTPIVRMRDLRKRFGGAAAVDGISLDVADGEFLALLGPSGCGKTTLLRMLGGFLYPDNGAVFIDGKDMTYRPPNKRPVNMLFQSYAVFPHMTVADNVAYGLRVVGVSRDETKRRVGEALALVRMTELAKRMPDKLSGGQRQRVALARALIKRPRVLLLDEPLSALDANLREAMQAELVKLQRAVGVTFIIVTHDQDEALSMAGRIAVMEGGRLRQVDEPRALYESPNSRFVANFIGRMNILPGVVSADGRRMDVAGVGELPLGRDAAARPGESAYCGARPEKLRFSAAATGECRCWATVESLAYHGDETVLKCRVNDDTTLLCARNNDNRREAADAAPGQSGWLSWSADDMILLRD